MSERIVEIPAENFVESVKKHFQKNVKPMLDYYEQWRSDSRRYWPKKPSNPKGPQPINIDEAD